MAIRPVTPADEPHVRDLYKDKEYQSRVGGRDAAKDVNSQLHAREFGMLALHAPSDDRLVGICILSRPGRHDFDGRNRLEISVGILPNEREQKYATKATRAVTEKFRELVRDEPLVARFDLDNDRSAKIMKHLSDLYELEGQRPGGRGWVYVCQPS